MSDIVKVVESYGLEITNNSKVCCPFHKENTPSLSLYESTESFFCFGCGESGDSISFVRAMEPELTFKQAVSRVEEVLERKVELSSGEEKKHLQKVSKAPALPLDVLKELAANTVYQNVGYRGIRKETDEACKVRSKVVNGVVTTRYYPETNDDGKICGLTCRNEPKDFTHGHIGKVGVSSQWDGRFLYEKGGKYIVIVGGQEDRLAAIQMFKDAQRDNSYLPTKVVSPTKGEGNAVSQLSKSDNYEFLCSHDNIIIGFDSDSAGVEAAHALAELLPKHKVKIATWSKKDPSEMLQLGLNKQFISNFYEAKDVIETGIHGSSSSGGIDDLKEFLLAPKISLPPQLHRVQTNMRGGIKSTGCIGIIAAHTSTGKTLLSDLCLYHWIMAEQIRPIIVSIERTKEELKLDLLSMHLHKNLTWFEEGADAVAYMERPDIKPLVDSFFSDEFGRDRFYVIDERDGSLDKLKAQMEMAHVKYDTDLFIIDPVSDVLRQHPNDVQDDFFMWQKYQKKKGWKILNIFHTRKPAKSENGKTPFVTEYDVLGSGTSIQSADWTWVLNRDKMAEDVIERNTLILDMPKIRGGITGHATDLYYDSETRQQYDKIDYFDDMVEKEYGEIKETINQNTSIIEDIENEVESITRTDEDVEWN